MGMKPSTPNFGEFHSLGEGVFSTVPSCFFLVGLYHFLGVPYFGVGVSPSRGFSQLLFWCGPRKEQDR